MVLASGFFEWQQKGKQKIPFYISLKNEELFVFAGLWDSWSDNNGSIHNTYTIITTQANEFMEKIHNTKKRMPVILTPNKAKDWISQNFPLESICNFLEPPNSLQLKAYTIRNFLPMSKSTYYNANLIDYFNYSKTVNTSNDKNAQISLDLWNKNGSV